MEFAEVLQAYTEVGILGLSAILVVLLFYKLVMKNSKDADKQIDRIEHKDAVAEDNYTKMLNMFERQQDEFRKQQQEMMDKVIQVVTDKINNHVPDHEETEKITKISEKVDELLQDILLITHCDRANLVQYHNGGHGMNKQGFMKMSMSNEQVQIGIKPFMAEFKDQFRSILAYFTKELNDHGKCFINDIEDIKSIDASMYEFLNNRGIKSKYGMAIKDHDGYVIGFVSVEYVKDICTNPQAVKDALAQHCPAIEALMNL